MGFDLSERQHEDFDMTNYANGKVGLRRVDDVTINLGTYRKINSNYGDKTFVLNAIYQHDYPLLREISNYFYESSGIYYRLCKYFATLYRYDWYVTPYIADGASEAAKKKALKAFSDVLLYLDKSEVKRTCGNTALDMIIDGAFYGILIDFGDKMAIQKLPASYCRCRYFTGTDPLVELNLRFFDAVFPNMQYRLQVLKTFPKDVQQAYVLYKQGKLPGDFPGDRSCWYALDPATSVRISLNDREFPPLIGVIPSIIDLDQAQDLDRKKTMQQLLKIIVQKLPLDKNGDLIFDVDEAKDIHNNAVAMLKRAVGVDVLTTFADIEKIDTKDSNSATTTDDLEKAERTVYNNSGISQNLFNADGNLAVTNSILTDEASIRDIPLQFEALLNRVIEKFNKRGCTFRASILETTQYNYKEVSKLYKEQAQMGYQKTLPQIALGHSQSSILAMINFENDILHLAESMVPPMLSSTQSASSASSGEVGRPKKDDEQKSDKTIANQESES